jgi:hypothetical protein
MFKLTMQDWIQLGGITANLLISIVAIVVAVKSFRASARAAEIAEASLADARKAAYDQEKPYPIAYLDLEPSGDILLLVVKNLGHSPARDVVISGTPSLEPPFNRRSNWPSPIATLAPGQELRWWVAPIHGVYRNKTWAPDFEVTISYLDQSNKRIEERVTLTFAAFEGTLFNNEGKAAERALEDIARHTRGFDQDMSGHHWSARMWGALLRLEPEFVVSRTEDGFTCHLKQGPRPQAAPIENVTSIHDGAGVQPDKPIDDEHAKDAGHQS